MMVDGGGGGSVIRNMGCNSRSKLSLSLISVSTCSCLVACLVLFAVGMKWEKKLLYCVKYWTFTVVIKTDIRTHDNACKCAEQCCDRPNEKKQDKPPWWREIRWWRHCGSSWRLGCGFRHTIINDEAHHIVLNLYLAIHEIAEIQTLYTLKTGLERNIKAF